MSSANSFGVTATGAGALGVRWAPREGWGLLLGCEGRVWVVVGTEHAVLVQPIGWESPTRTWGASWVSVWVGGCVGCRGVPVAVAA